MTNIENLHPNVIINSRYGKGDAGIIQNDNIDNLVLTIIKSQLNFKEVVLLQAQSTITGVTNELDLNSPATYMNTFLRFIYMYENNLLEIRCDQANYTYNEMKHKADVKYQRCKLAETVMLANQWRFNNDDYIHAVKCYNGTRIPSKTDLDAFKQLYTAYKNTPFCSVHTDMLKAVIDKFSFDVQAAKAKLNNLKALIDLNQQAGYSDSNMLADFENLKAKIQAA